MPTLSVTTGCRVDLAGGTFDIWPLGLLHPRSITTNVAIDLPIRVRLRRRSSGYCVRQGEVTIEVASRSELIAHPPAALVGIVADELELPPLEVEIDSASPQGGGLGASSALNVALVALGERLTGTPPRNPAARARLAQDLEARLMSLPTGSQDYYPPQLGGALALRHPAGGTEVRRLAVDLDALSERLLVAYSGDAHFSAQQNWQMVRRRLDREGEIVRLFGALEEVSAALPERLEAGDFAAVGALLSEEWRHRRKLAAGISTPAVERLLAAAAEAGAWGGKVCGAGGGGCVAVLCPPAVREAVAARLTSVGGEVLAAAPRCAGLELIEE